MPGLMILMICSLPRRLRMAWEFHRSTSNGWRSQPFQYKDKADGTAFPHITLLTTQYNVGKNGFIMQGELDVIIAAMHFRINQPLYEDEEEEDEQDEEDELRFLNERRFPVSRVKYNI